MKTQINQSRKTESPTLVRQNSKIERSILIRQNSRKKALKTNKKASHGILKKSFKFLAKTVKKAKPKVIEFIKDQREKHNLISIMDRLSKNPQVITSGLKLLLNFTVGLPPSTADYLDRGGETVAAYNQQEQIEKL